MKINKLIILGLMSVFFLNTSCTDDLNVNQNPLVATAVEPSLLMPTIMVAVSQNRTIELNALNIQAQQWASGGSAGVFANPERYIISPNTTNNVWVGQYSTALRNLKEIRLLTEANNPAALNQIGQAKIYEAFVFFNLTSLFEDIPMSQATQVDLFPNPEFDSQEDVLFQIVERVDEGIALLQTETDIIGNADLVYGGNRENWIRFGNSLKLQCLMLIANKNPTAVQAQLQQVANAPLIENASQNANFSYSDIAGNENPIWRTLNAFSGGNNNFFFAGETLVNLMNEREDPRRNTYFNTNASGNYVGQTPGVLNNSGISRVSLNIIRKDLEDRYFTAAQTHFLLAEAALNGWISANAQFHFNAGIAASMNSYDGQPGAISANDKQDYLAAHGSIEGLPLQEQLLRVHQEHYISLFTQGLEGLTQWKRAKEPFFVLPQSAAITDIIRRYQYPLSEETANPNAPPQKALSQPMWYEN